MKKKILSLLIIVVLLFLPACSSNKDEMNTIAYTSDAADVVREMETYSSAPMMSEETAGFSPDTGYTDSVENINDISDRKLIKKVSVFLETTDYDSCNRQINNLVNSLSGYIETSEISNPGIRHGSSEKHHAYYRIRIPSDKLDSFINSVGSVGVITSSSMNTDDVTLSYVDTESRKKALTIQQERILTLLKEAKNMEDILILEERLNNITYQLEKNENILRNYDNLVEYSTVELNINEVERTTTILEEASFADEIKSGLSDTFYEIGNALTSFALWFIINLPYLLIIGILLMTIIILLVKKAKRNKMNNKPSDSDSQERVPSQADTGTKDNSDNK